MGITQWIPRAVKPTTLQVHTLHGNAAATYQVILNTPPQTLKEQHLLQAILKIFPECHVAYLDDTSDAIPTVITALSQKTWFAFGAVELAGFTDVLPSLPALLAQPYLKKKLHHQLSLALCSR